MTNSPIKVNRERIFLLATRGQQDPLEVWPLDLSFDVPCLACPGPNCLTLSQLICFLATLQGLQLQSPSDMHQSAHAAWNRCCKPPVSAWLLAKQSALDKERLKACGNVVIPQCARLALHIMGNHLCGRHVICQFDGCSLSPKVSL